MEIGIEFVYDGEFDHLVAERILLFLVSQGAKYNAGEYPGQYGIVGEHVNEEIHCIEDAPCEDKTEKLADILAQYRTFDPAETSLSIYLDGPDFPFGIVFVPHREGPASISLRTSVQRLEAAGAYEAFVALAESLCRRFPFVYGAYRSEHMDYIPLRKTEILTAEPQAVLYFGPELVEKIGAEPLLSAPAASVRQHDNGGVFLVACYDRYGGCIEIDAIKAHLGL